jgi:3-deoxy-D-manno-octulosonic acid kinase
VTAGAAPPDVVPVTASHAQGLAERLVVPALLRALDGGRTLHAWAESQPGARAFQGRATAWAVTLGPEAVVVRHSTHGGVLAPVTGDLFRAPTRAPAEFESSRRIAAMGIPTPAVIAYVVYPAALGFARADVATREVPHGEDLLAALARLGAEERRVSVLPAVAALLEAMTAGGVQHPDLNAKNILLAPGADGAPVAWLLDTDVVTFGAAGDAAIGAANRARLARSLAKRAGALASPLEAIDRELLGLIVEPAP